MLTKLNLIVANRQFAILFSAVLFYFFASAALQSIPSIYLFSAAASGIEMAIYACFSVAFAVAGGILLHRSGPTRWLAAFVSIFAVLCVAAALARRFETVYAVLFLLASYPVALFSGLVPFLTSRVSPRRHATVVGALTVAAFLSPFPARIALSGLNWLFLAEAVLAIVLGVTGWLLLLGERSDFDRQRTAPETVGIEVYGNAGSGQGRVRGKAGTHLRVIALAAVYLGMNVALVVNLPFAVQAASRGFWMSSQQIQIGLAACGAFGCAGMIILARRSDLALERKWHATTPILIGSTANLVALHSREPILVVAAFVVAYVALWAAKPVFWPLAAATAGSGSPAVGIGFINAIGSLGIFVAPVSVWASRSLVGTEAWGLFFVGLFPFAGGLLMAGCIRDVSRS